MFIREQAHCTNFLQLFESPEGLSDWALKQRRGPLFALRADGHQEFFHTRSLTATKKHDIINKSDFVHSEI